MSESSEARRKRLIHRSLYTGMKETDILLGAFAKAHVPSFTSEQLDMYERLLEAGDPNILDWATGRASAPADQESEVLTLLKNFKIVQ
ncbi:MAG: succinate dehydrogenase assembly factor 2 [Rhodospirillales bacterium]|nr:succinate dehydrogenase assembly factor 2 [Rhodospirillales bacterium]